MIYHTVRIASGSVISALHSVGGIWVCVDVYRRDVKRGLQIARYYHTMRVHEPSVPEIANSQLKYVILNRVPKLCASPLQTQKNHRNCNAQEHTTEVDRLVSPHKPTSPWRWRRRRRWRTSNPLQHNMINSHTQRRHIPPIQRTRTPLSNPINKHDIRITRPFIPIHSLPQPILALIE